MCAAQMKLPENRLFAALFNRLGRNIFFLLQCMIIIEDAIRNKLGHMCCCILSIYRNRGQDKTVSHYS